MNLHAEGGMEYMAPLSIMFLAILIMMGLAFYSKYAKHTDPSKLTFAIHHVSLIALVWGMLGTAIGLFYAFGALSQMETVLPFNIIMGGLRVALITALYGMIIFIVARVGLVFLRP